MNFYFIMVLNYFHRRHFLQCPPGLLSKHFEKLIQCDPRLNSLSGQPEIILESPFFESRCSVFEDHDESKSNGLDDLKDGFGSTRSGFQDPVLPLAASSTSTKTEVRVPTGRTTDSMSQETPSPSSGTCRSHLCIPFLLLIVYAHIHRERSMSEPLQIFRTCLSLKLQPSIC